MKKFILCLIAVLLGFSVSAQDGLCVKQVFDTDEIITSQDKIITVVKGSDLKDYDLKVFKSVKVKSTMPDIYKIVADAVLDDSLGALAKETVVDGGYLIYALLQLQPGNKLNRYVAFRGDGSGFTLVYMEGTVSLKDLKRMFRK